MRKHLVCSCRIELTLIVKIDNIGSVNKVISKIFSKNDTVKILATGSRIVTSCLADKASLDSFKLLFKRKVKTQIIDYAVISFLDSVELAAEILALRSKIIAAVKHISYLCIV